MKKFTLILIGVFLSSIFVFAQQKQITLNLNNVTVKEALEALKSTGGYSYWFDAKDLNISQKVSINVVNKTIDEVLSLLFKGQKVEYKIKDGHIVISKSVEKEPQIQKKNELKKVTGVVLDEKGIPVIGASVMIPGTKIVVITDVNGKFSVEAPNVSKLRISYIGYEAKEEEIKGSSLMKISLAESPQKLEDVVVVGYGSQKKETVVGSISTMKATEVVQTPATNLTNALNGRLPGLVAMQRQGQPGKDQSEIYIRGKATFEAAASTPLTLVDGIERPFAEVDPNEVETITILKDASATAVYGVRGANGVILVTTKRGTTGKAEISFTANTGIQNPTRTFRFKDANEVAATTQQGYFNDYGTYYYTQNQLATIARVVYGGASEDEKLLYPNLNWTKELTQNNIPQQQYNLNIRGGTKSVRYFISGGYYTQGSWFKNLDQYYEGVKKYNSNYQFDRYNFRSNLDIDITKNFTASLNLATRIESINNDKQSDWGFIQQLFGKTSLDPPIYYPGIGFAADSQGGNLLGNNLVQGGFNNTTKSTLESSIILRYKLDFITKGLSTRANVSFDSEYDYSKTFWERPDAFKRDLNFTDKAVYTSTQKLAALIDNGESYSNSTKRYEEIGLDYSRQFGKHDVTGLLLFNNQLSTIGATTPYAYEGIVGRVTYGFSRKYLAEVNVGYNGSENFAPGKRFGFFPAFSAGWVLSEEAFIKNIELINWLKIRGSYGEVGNDKLYINGALQRFLYYNDYAQASNGYIFGNSGGFQPMITEGRIGNPDVTWERAKKSNIGLESKLFDQKIGFTLDLFQEYRNDILLSQTSTIPGTLGAVLPAVNKGRTYNSGFEFELFHQYKIGDFSYQIKGNYTFARSKVLFVDESSAVASWQRVTGQPIGQPLIYQCIGFYQSADDIKNSPSEEALGGKPVIGDRKYLDYNNDGVINSLDATRSGYSSVPEITYGLNLNCQYKGVDFSVLFQGVDHITLTGLSGLAVNSNVENTWSPFKTAEENADAMYPTPHSVASTINSVSSSGKYGNNRSGAYLKLKNVEIGYSLPKTVLKLVHINACRIYLNGINLAILYDELKTIDPESASSGVVYPQMQTVNFGLNIKF
jgi:TonB-linked SusC/RagA family outer membrane protein